MNNGWVKLSRRMLDWEWLSDGCATQFFVYCLLKANHATNKWRGHSVESGQFITSLAHISHDLGLSIQQVRTCIKKLKSTGEITSKTTNKFTLISITNWEFYQHGNKQPNNEITNEQQTNNNQSTTNKNDKKNNKEKNENKLDFTLWPSMPNDQIFNDWLAMRKRLKAPVSQTVVNTIGKQLAIATDKGFTVDDCISECVTRNWKGFKAEWITKDAPESAKTRKML